MAGPPIPAGTVAALGLRDCAAAGAPPAADLRITGIACDSRAVKRGNLFVALTGHQADGADFVPAAIAAGASLLLMAPEALARVRTELPPDAPPILLDPDPRRRLALALARFWGAQPSQVVAITGTNGKTSSVGFLRQLWVAAGCAAASIGTLGIEGTSEAMPIMHTTPDPVTLHRVLAQLASADITHLAVEASSHALDQRRLDGVDIPVAAFTNLSRDHFDYHGSRAAYAAAKLRLFRELLAPAGCAVANVDDPVGEAALQAARARGCRTLAVGRAAGEGGLQLQDCAPVPDGQRVMVRHEGRTRQLVLPLAGAFQVDNALVAAACAMVGGMDPEAVFESLTALAPVRGRMERVASSRTGGAVFVDYAHTPDALRAALAAARCQLGPQGQLHAVLGAGGQRDQGKRAEMGAVAAELADRVIVTDDNPRGEDPAVIRAAIRRGAPRACEIGDRAAAIGKAVSRLQAGDVLVIAGKGHEQTQETAAGKVPFDDAAVARAAAGAS